MVTDIPHRASRKELCELHFHLGQSLEPQILWSIAHEQGIKLPSKDYWEFHDLITLNKEDVTWDDYHKLFHWTELIQSSPVAMERTVYEVVSGAYRANNITVLEPSFNPMFRNRGGEQDLDHIILAGLRGMERALIEFPTVRAGLILLLDRRLPVEKNAIVARKAIKYRSRGVVGIDIAGPKNGDFRYEDYRKLYDEVREAGLKTTVHTGEDGTVEEMAHVLKVLALDRINHGFRCAEDPAVMKEVAKRNLCLCLCPTSSLVLKFIKDTAHLKTILRTLIDSGVKFCVNTDNPSMLKTNLAKEIGLVRDAGILSEDEIDQTLAWAREASFIPTQPGKNLYL
ncbi:MAG: adenosine deaminase [Candidatus Peregrinibacteria bacterium Gr01-1014_25]|nr:MAG: adenosine deaminase [Candidatus Peregrinibacteria bacterium Gr01-1014_25]